MALAGSLVPAGLASAFASSAGTNPDRSLDELKAAVAAPFSLAVRDRRWDGNPHAMPAGRAALEDRGQKIWELADVATAASSADGSTVALLTAGYEVYVSRLPEAPRRVEGGPYLSAALSSDGTFLLAQRLGEGSHILERTYNAHGIALINLDTGEDRLILEGNDLFSPSFASDQRVFFGSGAEDGIASLYLLDLSSMAVARVTNRVKDARQTFPSEAPRLSGGNVVYRADDERFSVPEPAADAFQPAGRFDAPQPAELEPMADFGSVRLRLPTTQSNNPQIMWYYDLNRVVGIAQDWNCQLKAYDQHQGTDFNQSLGYDVVAPASGEVIRRHDGCPNTKVAGCGTGWGNHVGIQHSDGTTSLEAHGKKWTVVGYGTYACGDKLMESASSGNSGKAHVHHESWKSSSPNHRFDPYQGPCDPLDASKWGQQNGYLSLPGTTCTH
jgi:murein DD-endopeptidase MepM/ murein hydrolase activator NlpD